METWTRRLTLCVVLEKLLIVTSSCRVLPRAKTGVGRVYQAEAIN